MYIVCMSVGTLGGGGSQVPRERKCPLLPPPLKETPDLGETLDFNGKVMI